MMIDSASDRWSPGQYCNEHYLRTCGCYPCTWRQGRSATRNKRSHQGCVGIEGEKHAVRHVNR